MARWIIRAISVAFVTGLTAFLSLSATGIILLPLPSPAHGRFANAVAPHVLMWRPRPLVGDFAANERLTAAVRLFEGRIHGPESVVVGPSGQLVMLDRTGALHQAWPDPAEPGGWRLEPQPLARLGPGRPLGYHFDGQGNLIVADSLKGLVKYDYATGDITLLASHVSSSSAFDPGSEITYANDLAIAQDGVIYFTSCTDIVPPLNKAGFYDTYRAWFLGVMQGLPRGRLLKYDPATREATVIAKVAANRQLLPTLPPALTDCFSDASSTREQVHQHAHYRCCTVLPQGFYYANGVALSADDSYVVMAETDRIRAHKIWVKGPKAGQLEVLVDNLPGVPDGVDEASAADHAGAGEDSDGSAFWISLLVAAPPFTNPLLSRFLSNPLVRAAAAWAPRALRPGLKKWTAVVKVDGAGRVLDFLMDGSGAQVATLSAVSESGGKLWLGNLAGSYVSYLDLAQEPPQSAA